MKVVTILRLLSLSIYGFTEVKPLEITKPQTAQKIALNKKTCFAYKLYQVEVTDDGERAGNPKAVKSVVFGKWYTREEIQKLAEEPPKDLKYQNILRYMIKEQLYKIVITRTGNYLVPEVGTVVFDHTKPPTS